MTEPVARADLAGLTTTIGSLYPDARADDLAARALAAIGLDHHPPAAPPPDPRTTWGADDILLITYADALRADGEAPLATLGSFLEERLAGAVSMVHILPFFPSSSDGGFSVVDYLAVDEALGDWGDVSGIAASFTLMADLVLNHASADSAWFRQFSRDELPGRDYFVTAEPDADLSRVVRPRTHPLLRWVETPSRVRHAWCTFSHDQPDLDFSNPEVLLEFLRIIDAYLDAGVRLLRLDAVAYLWKRPGTTCIHLPETHLVVRLLRTLLAARCPDARLVTETNVPNRENLTYFGNANEAHAIYNFTLPPLLLDALLRGRSDHLQTWMMSMPPAPPGAAYLNFIASHDGIGLRPAEGILSDDEIAGLAQAAEARGGQVSAYAAPGGARPYELNIALIDALSGDDGLGVERFICAHAIMLALEGVPAVYIHSLLATPNDHDNVAREGTARAINRARRSADEVCAALDEPGGTAKEVFRRLMRLMAIRRRQPAFHPNAPQLTLDLKPWLFGVRRQSMDRDQSLFAVANVTAEPRGLDLAGLDLAASVDWGDLITGKAVTDVSGRMTLPAYGAVWLTTRAD